MGHYNQLTILASSSLSAMRFSRSRIFGVLYKDRSTYIAFRLTRTFWAMSQTFMPTVLSPNLPWFLYIEWGWHYRLIKYINAQIQQFAPRPQTPVHLVVCHKCVYPYPEPVVFQWQSSDNPVCLGLRPQCTLECHWRNASVLPVVFQWLSSGLPVCSNYANWIATGTPLSASIIQCGSSGIPVYWQNLVWRSLGQVTSQDATLMFTPGMVRVVWAKPISFEFQPQIHKNFNAAHIKSMHRVMLKYSHVLRAELASIAEQQTPSKGWMYRDLSTCLLVSRHLVISNWRGCYSACLTICVGACVGCHSPSSGVPL